MRVYLKKFAAGLYAAVVCAAAMPALPAGAGTEAYLVRDPFYNFSSDYNYYESQHFQFIWGNTGADSAAVTTDFLEGNAKNMEKIWDIYMNDLQMAPPSQSTNLSIRDGKEYKTNIYISGTGLPGMSDDWAYMAYDKDDFAYMFCCVGSMAVEPPSWVLPHEFGHVVTAHQLGMNDNIYAYAWWETLGNWFREQCLAKGYSPNSDACDTDFFETYLKNLSFTFPCGRDYYSSWPFLQYLVENPEGLEGCGSDFAKRVLQEGMTNEYPFDMVDRLAAADLKDILGYFAAHMAGLDFKNGENYRLRMKMLRAMDQANIIWQQVYTMPEPVEEPFISEEKRYTVPTERAPQFAGINIIPLTAEGDTVEVTLEAPDKKDGEHWRACIVEQAKDGSCTYSKLFDAGEKVTAAYSGGELYLTVAAVPDLDKIQRYGLPEIYNNDSRFSEGNVPFMSKDRYPYDIILGEGVSVTQRTAETFTGMWAQYPEFTKHPNGGGLVSRDARVDESVYVGPDACVKDFAVVTGDVKLLGHAVVAGDAQVSGNAVVSDFGVVEGNAVVTGNARISDCGIVRENANISGNAMVYESACIYGKAVMKDDARAKGCAFVMGDAELSGQAVVDGDYYDDSGKKLTKGTSFGWTSSQSYSDSRPYTENLMYGYEFADDTMNDSYNSTYIRGKYKYESERTGAKGVVTLANGGYLSLDKSVLYGQQIEIQVGFMSRNTNGGGQSLLHFGGDKAYIEAAVIGDHLWVEITDGEEKVTLQTAKGTIEPGTWNIARIALTGDSAALLLGGKAAGEKSTKIKPCDILDAEDEGKGYFVGFGMNGAFNGSVDFVRIFNGTGTAPAEIYSEKEDVTAQPAEGDIRYGDANCDGAVTIADCTIILQSMGNPDLYKLSEQGAKNADCYEPGSGVTGLDALAIQQLDANLIESLPVFN